MMLNPRRVEFWIALAVGGGAVCRVAQYLARTSVWHDEAYVALNVLHRGYRALFGALDWNEAAPPGFLFVEKAVVALFGHSEYAWRLAPVVAGVAGVVAFAVLLRRCSLPGAAAFWSVLLLAFSDKLIEQANEIKHFTLDLVCAVALTYLALRVRYEARAGPWLLVWGAVGAISFWLSYSSVFVFAGSALWLLAAVGRRWRGAEWAACGLASAATAVSAACLLAGPVAAQRQSAVLDFWSGSFPALGNPPAFWWWLGRAVLGLFNYFWQPYGAALLALAAIGMYRCIRQNRAAGSLLGLIYAPVMVALVASLLRHWPFGGNQHMAFAAPAILIPAGLGIEELRTRLGPRRRWIFGVIAAALLVPGLGSAAYHLVAPRLRHGVRAALECATPQAAPTDHWLVYCPAEFEFYTGRAPRLDSDEIRAGDRVWVISARHALDPIPEVRAIAGLRSKRPQLAACEAFGAAAYLFGPEHP